MLIDATAADTIRPAGLRAGIAGLTPSAAAATYDKQSSDIKALVGAISPATRPVIICNNGAQAISLSWFQLPASAQNAGLAGAVMVISSPVVPVGMVIALDLDSFAYALDAPLFELSPVGLLHEEDTAPLPIIAAGPTPAFPVRSLWQTDTQSLRLIWFVNWALTRTGAVAFMSGVTW